MENLSELDKNKYKSIGEEIDKEYPKIMKEMQDALCRVEQASKKASGIKELPQDMISVMKRSCERELKWLAESNMINKVSSAQEKKSNMKDIEEFLMYIRNYEKNKEILKDYKEHQDRTIDDGR